MTACPERFMDSSDPPRIGADTNATLGLAEARIAEPRAAGGVGN